MREATTRRTPNPCCAQRPAPKEACGPCYLWGRQGFTRWPERREILKARPNIRTERWTKLDILGLHQAGSSFWAPLLAPSSWPLPWLGPRFWAALLRAFPLQAPTLLGSGPNPFLPPKLNTSRIGRSRYWPKSILTEVDFGHSCFLCYRT